VAVTSRVATLQLTTTPDTGTRTWTATAVSQDTAAGSSVSISVVQNKAGAAPPALPDTLTLSLLIDDTQTQIVAFSPTPNDTDGNTQNFTFFFTDTGLTGGAARAGTVKLKLRAINTTGVSAVNYNVNTDANPADTFGTGNTNTVGTRNKGWIRGTTTSAAAASNVALGGAKTEPAKYHDSLFVRHTLGATLYTSRALTVALSNTTPSLSGSTNSATSGNYDATFSSAVTNRYPASAAASVTNVSAPNATLTGTPDFTVTQTTDSINVDPRITFTPLMQVNTAAFSTPPFSSNVTSHQRLSSDLAFLAWNARDSRGSQAGSTISGGVNGLAWTQHLRDVGNLIADQTQAVTSQTQGGEAGWNDSFQAWSSSLPGGTWNFTAVITTSDATGLESGAATTYSLLAANLNLVVVPDIVSF